jgi:hypothetical protein
MQLSQIDRAIEQGISPVMQKELERLGFSFKKGSTHTSRTLMLSELSLLLSHTGSTHLAKEAYLQAILNDNILGKLTYSNRSRTSTWLVELYSLDHKCKIFNVLHRLWFKDVLSQAHLALLCAYCRDAVFRALVPVVLAYEQGAAVRRAELESVIERKYDHRFGPALIRSLAQNINASLTQSGHLRGKALKVRQKLNPRPVSVAYALFLGHLCGYQGQALLQTKFIQLLDLDYQAARMLMLQAVQQGYLIVNQLGDVIEVKFDPLILD